jgi:hypothetical protein
MKTFKTYLVESELEQYRKHALSLIAAHKDEWQKIAEASLGVTINSVKPIGSVTNSAKFNENSDIDVGFFYTDLSQPSGVNETMSEQLQKVFVSRPIGDLGVINTIVFNVLK